MKFIGKPVYSYGNTIVLAEFNKPSGYDSVLTAETIRATNMWMATANALYEGVNLCKKGSVSSIDDANYVDPIDKAAAFWFGTHDDAGVSKGGSLYAWARRMDGHFFNHVEDTTFTANGKILECLKELQMDLANCLSSTTEDSVREELAYKMRIYADDVTRYMTIPLVQSLIYYSADLAGNANAGVNVENYVILYALVSLPPIRVCNSDAFNDLYERLVTNPEDGSLSENLKMLENLYVCLQITCDQVGMPNFACEDPPDNISIAGYEGTSDVLLQVRLLYETMLFSIIDVVISPCREYYCYRQLQVNFTCISFFCTHRL